MVIFSSSKRIKQIFQNDSRKISDSYLMNSEFKLRNRNYYVTLEFDMSHSRKMKLKSYHDLSINCYQ
jgi:hypothetical protein